MFTIDSLRTSRSFLIALALACVISQNSASGQSILKIYGQVVDKQGAVGNALVEIINTPFKTFSNQDGYYYFYDIPPGAYQLSCSLGSLAVRTNDKIAVGDGPSVRRDVFFGKDIINAAPVHVVATAPDSNTDFGLIVKSYQIDSNSNRSVEELIGNIPGLNLISSPATGETYISANGVRSEGVNVYIDGRPLNSLLTGKADLEQIPLRAISEIEYYSPGANDAASGGGLGGTVNLITNKYGDANILDYSMSRGSFGDENYIVGINYRISGYGVIKGIWDKSFIRNDYRYKDEFGESFIRINAQAGQDKYYFSYSNAAGDYYLSLTGFAYEGINGVPGLTNGLSTEAISNKKTVSAGGELSRTLGKSAGITTGLSYQERKTSYENYGSDSWIPFDTEYHERVINWTSGWEYFGSKWLKINTKLAYENSMLNGRDFIRPDNELGRITRDLFKASNNMKLSHRFDRISLSTGLSNSYIYVDNTDYLTTSLGSSLIFRMGVSIGVRSSYARSFRLPGLAELHWHEDVFVLPNPDLKPERSRSLSSEIYAAFQGLGDWRLSIEYRDIRYKDLIYWRRSQGVRYQPKNVSNSDFFGFVLALSYQSPNGVLRLDYSRTNSTALNKEEGDASVVYYGKYIIHQPLYMNNLKIDLSYGVVSLAATIRDSGRSYFTEENTKWLDPYTLVNLSAGIEFKVKKMQTRWEVKIENLTDIEYALLEYQPMPPRSFNIGMTIKL